MNRLHTMVIDNLFSECYGEELIKPHKAQNLGINTILANSKKLNFEGLYIVVVSNVEEISVNLIESINKSKKL